MLPFYYIRKRKPRPLCTSTMIRKDCAEFKARWWSACRFQPEIATIFGIAKKKQNSTSFVRSFVRYLVYYVDFVDALAFAQLQFICTGYMIVDSWPFWWLIRENCETDSKYLGLNWKKTPPKSKNKVRLNITPLTHLESSEIKNRISRLEISVFLV